MTDITKTLTFVLTAGLLVAAAIATWYATQPREVGGFEKVGEEFFPDFVDPSAARALEVTAYDPDSGTEVAFAVEYKDGLWRIPSHYGYPAEAAERLAQTAASLIGVRRESLVARRETEQARFAVLEPADDEADADSAGKRVTLRDDQGTILADFVIGRPAGSDTGDGPDELVRDAVQRDDYYYVRVPGEKETYKAEIDIDLSTRFTDWIEPDLLKVDQEEINKLEINSYELIEEMRGLQLQVTKLTQGQFRLTRDGFEPWSMEGLNETTEELDMAEVNSLLELLDEMVIVGVRPKPSIDGQPLVGSDLTVNAELAKQNPAAFQDQLMFLQQDLEDKGFVIGADQDNPSQLMLLATKGELGATTSNGVAYTLFFGKGVSGDETEIEIGKGSKSDPSGDDADAGESGQPDPSASAEPGSTESAGDPAAEVPATESDDEDSQARNRYVAIRVEFDPSALGQPPVEPVKPVAPPARKATTPGNRSRRNPPTNRNPPGRPQKAWRRQTRLPSRRPMWRPSRRKNSGSTRQRWPDSNRIRSSTRPTLKCSKPIRTYGNSGKKPGVNWLPNSMNVLRSGITSFRPPASRPSGSAATTW